MKRMKAIFGILCCLLIGVDGISQEGSYVNKVVIDAGHGGKDPGALGRNSQEKDIVLKIALKTGQYIEENIDGVEVIYTRKTDKFVELHKRADIANKNDADLFISIHCNANKVARAKGAETYVMGLHKTEENLEVAKEENAAILLEEDYRQEYDGFDPNSDEGYISLSLMQNEYRDQSIKMAKKVQDQFRERVGLKDRSVRQAGFLLLYQTTMPGILIETAFLSNPGNEKFLMSKRGQAYIASGIYRAFKEYKHSMEKGLPPREEALADKSNNDGGNNGDSHNSDPEIYFTVQIDTSPESINVEKFATSRRVSEYKHNGVFKYITGNTTSLKEARKIKREMRAKGYEGAFIVAFYNHKRIRVQKAIELMEKSESP
ncbi:MAG: N-acetylmuramoyl-L-alanine amidase [Bacteroidales bacterium]|nr:N-acetylmuramoyl-L-alanine amidase [Bacteroidales bacterium]MCF8337573.1 N-acetylmuramoyl-L-alanine amidase [Bacteroidales bacterium]